MSLHQQHVNSCALRYFSGLSDRKGVRRVLTWQRSPKQGKAARARGDGGSFDGALDGAVHAADGWRD